MWSRDFVKIEHLPTGLAAVSDRSRSNFKNKADCMSILRGKLWHLENGAETITATDAQRAIAARILKA